MKQRIRILYIQQIKGIKMFPMSLKWKVLDYMIKFILMLYYLHPHFINMPIHNVIINLIPPQLMVKNPIKNHQFQH